MTRSLFFQPINARLNERYCGSEAELRAALIDIASSPLSARSVVVVDTVALTSPLILSPAMRGLEMRFVGQNARLIPAPGRLVSSALVFNPAGSTTTILGGGFNFINLRVFGDGGSVNPGLTGTFSKIFDMNTSAPLVSILGGSTSLASSGVWGSGVAGFKIYGLDHVNGSLALGNFNRISESVFTTTDLTMDSGNMIASSTFRNATVNAAGTVNQLTGCLFNNLNTSAGTRTLVTGCRYQGTYTAAGTDVAAGNGNF